MKQSHTRECCRYSIPGGLALGKKNRDKHKDTVGNINLAPSLCWPLKKTNTNNAIIHTADVFLSCLQVCFCEKEVVEHIVVAFLVHKVVALSKMFVTLMEFYFVRNRTWLSE